MFTFERLDLFELMPHQLKIYSRYTSLTMQIEVHNDP